MEAFIAGSIVVFGVLFTVFFATALGVIVNGYVLSILWSWFIIPFGLPQLSIAHAIGVGMVMSFLTYQHQTSTEADKEKAGINLVVVLIIRPLAILGVGYIVKQFM